MGESCVAPFFPFLVQFNISNNNKLNNNNNNEKKFKKIIEKIANKNKEYIIKNNLDNENNFIKKAISKIKKEKTLEIKDPFNNKIEKLYKYNHNNYSKEEFENALKNNEIKITQTNIKDILLTIRSIDNFNYKILKNLYEIYKEKFEDDIQGKVLYLNTLLLKENNLDFKKELGKILLRNQNIIDSEELKLSYKLLNIY